MKINFKSIQSNFKFIFVIFFSTFSSLPQENGAWLISLNDCVILMHFKWFFFHFCFLSPSLPMLCVFPSFHSLFYSSSISVNDLNNTVQIEHTILVINVSLLKSKTQSRNPIQTSWHLWTQWHFASLEIFTQIGVNCDDWLESKTWEWKPALPSSHFYYLTFIMIAEKRVWSEDAICDARSIHRANRFTQYTIVSSLLNMLMWKSRTVAKHMLEFQWRLERLFCDKI